MPPRVDVTVTRDTRRELWPVELRFVTTVTTHHAKARGGTRVRRSELPSRDAYCRINVATTEHYPC
jgi:hypothetical protein